MVKTSGMMAGVVSVLIVLAITLFIAAGGDGLHEFTDADGVRHAVVSTEFPVSLITALPWAIAVFAAGSLLFGAALSRIAHLPFTEAVRRDQLTNAPLLLLAIILFRYLPNAGAISPGLLVLCTTAAPTVLAIALLLAAGLKIALWHRCGALDFNWQHLFPSLRDGQIAMILCLLAATAFSLFIPGHIRNLAFAGDQPHYLMETHSLLTDGDIFYDDEYREGIYRQFTSFSRLEPQAGPARADGRIAPFHRIGLSLLAVPFYAIGGKTGAVIMVGLFGALGIACLFLICLRMTNHRGASLLAAAWAGLSMPALPLSFRLFTEIPMAALTLASLVLTIGDDEQRPRWIIPNILIIWFIPWLHSAGFPVAVVLSLFLLWHLRKRTGALLIAGFAAILCGLTIPLWNWWLFGSFSIAPEAGMFSAGTVQPLAIFDHLLGAVFDNTFGVLLYNPAALLALICIPAVFRINRSLSIWLFAVAAASAAPGMALAHWWGTMNPTPTRYLTTVIFLAAVPLSAVLARGGYRKLKTVVLGVMAGSVTLALFLMQHSEMMIHDRGMEPGMLRAAAFAHAAPVTWWPSWFAESGQFLGGTLLLSGSLAVAVLVAGGIVVLGKKYGRRGSGALTVTLASVAVLCVFCLHTAIAQTVAAARLPVSGPVERDMEGWLVRTREGTSRMIEQADATESAAGPALTLGPRRFAPVETLRPDPAFGGSPTCQLNADSQSLPLPFPVSIWRGGYELIIRARSESGSRKAIFRANSPSIAKADSELASSGQVLLTATYQSILLPVQAPGNLFGLGLSIEADGPVRIASVTLICREVTTRSAWPADPDTFNLFLVDYGDFKLFLDADSVFPPEGTSFWLAGNATTTALFSSAHPFSRLVLNASARAGVVMNLDIGRERKRHLFDAAGKSVRKQLPLNPVRGRYGWSATVRLGAEGGGAPAEFDPHSHDHRFLGVFLHLLVR